MILKYFKMKRRMSFQDILTGKLAPKYSLHHSHELIWYDTRFNWAIVLCFYCQRSNLLMRELADCMPNSEMKWRRGSKIKNIIPEAVERDYTDIIIIEENRKIPSKGEKRKEDTLYVFHC